MNFRRVLAFSFALLISPLFFVHAQITGAAGGISSVIAAGTSLSIVPQTPGPNQSFTAVLQSSSVDLDSSTIVWTVNGQRVKSGQGIKTVTLTNGPLGSQTTVTADIHSPSGDETESQTLTPAEVDLLWEGSGYTPPFYEGRSLWANEGQLTLVAIPHVLGANGNEIDPSTLIYKWTQDDNVLGDSSGAGKNSLTITDSILSLPTTISVDILTNANTLAASRSETFTPQAVGLLVYEDHPLYGLLFNNEIESAFAPTDVEFSFAAFPLFFSASARDSGAVSYAWNDGAANPETGSKVTYRTPDTGPGSAEISLRASGLRNTIQSAQKSFLVQFGQTQQANL